jgi:pimeloyl-ACP methyl ester carboxylesterase
MMRARLVRTLALLVAVLLLVLGSSASAQQTTAAAPGLRAIRVNGTVLNYRDSTTNPDARAAGPAIIFVHGTLGNLDEWRRQLAYFAPKRRVITYSRRYHQPNAQVDDGQTYSPALHAEDLAALIRALDLGPVDLVGHSYGGAVALETARRYPELVHALVLGEPAVNMFGTGASRDSNVARAAMSISGLDSTRARFVRGDSLGAMKVFVDATGGDWDASPPGLKRYFLSQQLELRKEMTAPKERWIPPTTCDDLRPLTMPVLLMEGERTIPVYHGMDQRLAVCLAGAKLVIIPGVGHMHNDNSPFENQSIDDFLESVRRGSK